MGKHEISRHEHIGPCLEKTGCIAVVHPAVHLDPCRGTLARYQFAQTTQLGIRVFDESLPAETRRPRKAATLQKRKDGASGA